MNTPQKLPPVWFVLLHDGTWAGGFATFRKAASAQKELGGQIVCGTWFD